MTIDMKTLEHHHNALQVQFNLLLIALSGRSPDVVSEWLAQLTHVLDTEPLIPEKQRELMQAQFVRFAELMERIGKPKVH